MKSPMPVGQAQVGRNQSCAFIKRERDSSTFFFFHGVLTLRRVQSMIANEKSQRRRLLFLIRLRSKCARSQVTSWLCNELRAIERPQLLAGVVIILGAESFKAKYVPFDFSSTS